jgi:hypothetical protein
MADKGDISVGPGQQAVVNDDNRTLGLVTIRGDGMVVITTGQPVSIDRLVIQP